MSSFKDEAEFGLHVKDGLNAQPKVRVFRHHVDPFYSESGIADIIACVNGLFCGIELKQDGKHEQAIQTVKRLEFEGANAFTGVLHPSEFELFKQQIVFLLKETDFTKPLTSPVQVPRIESDECEIIGLSSQRD